MDDLEVYARSDKDLESLLQIMKDYSNDIGMEFGLDKCARATLKVGKFFKSSNFTIDVNTTLSNFE